MNISEETYIISDTHFGHDNILKHEPIRKQLLGHNPHKRLVEVWNETLTQNDTLFHLGDFAWKGDTIQTYSQLLNGQKYLLRGNHDKAPQTYLDNGFLLVIDFSHKGEAAYHIEILNGLKILFSHYPIVSDGFDDRHWKFLLEVFIQEKCDVNIHGHIHSMELNDPRCINVCVESIGFKPLRIGELLKKLNNNAR